MRFTVRALRRAERDYNTILEYIAARSSTGAAAWARAFDKALARLEDHADACPVAAENVHVDFEVREILFKTRRGLIYRVLFTIRDHDVLILHVRGPGQDFMDADEIAQPIEP
jgi:plasmid stabilization system protein ParE